MATYTTNLSLKKPAQSDKVRIADFNNNFDTIDDAIGAVGSTSLLTMINQLQDAVAIIANGDTHVAISSGDYVYVKNNTHGLSNGLYVASAAVSANGTISDSNMTADSKGGLNALNSNIITNKNKIFGGRRADIFDLTVTATANSGFTEVSKTFDSAFNAIPYVICTPKIQTDATNITAIVKTVSTTSVTFRVGNRGSVDVSVTLACVAIGA